MAIGNRKKDSRFFISFNILQFHGNSLWNFSCFSLFLGCVPLQAVSCLITRKYLLLFSCLFVVVFFFSIEWNLVSSDYNLSEIFFFHGSWNFLVFVFQSVLQAPGVAAGSLITLKYLWFSFLVELDIMSCDYKQPAFFFFHGSWNFLLFVSQSVVYTPEGAADNVCYCFLF